MLQFLSQIRWKHSYHNRVEFVYRPCMYALNVLLLIGLKRHLIRYWVLKLPFINSWFDIQSWTVNDPFQRWIPVQWMFFALHQKQKKIVCSFSSFLSFLMWSICITKYKHSHKYTHISSWPMQTWATRMPATTCAPPTRMWTQILKARAR